MGKIAFLFPGQGAQYPGMGKSLYENESNVKEFFDSCEAYREGTLKQLFEGEKEELTLTLNAQPCLYMTDLAAAMALVNHKIIPEAVAGFSLGELSALAFAGAYTAQDGFKIVCERAKLMNEAAKNIDSGMTAVVKMQDSDVEKACSEFDSVYPVNYNADGQLVVAGKKESLGDFKAKIKELGGKTIDLAVSGGFHSPFMNSAAEGFGKALEGFEISLPQMPVYANYDALPYSKNPKELLPLQINNPVRWKQIIKAMTEEGFDTFIEAGPGKVLSGLVKKIAPEATVYAADSTEAIEKIISEVTQNA